MNDNQFSSMKIFCHADKIARYQAKETAFPVSVDLSPSNFCNHGCVWCVYSKFLEKSKEILNKDVLLQLIADLKTIGARGINFTGGGEPLTNKFTVDAMEKAHDLGIDVGLITNGALLNRDSIGRLKRICKYIRISLDAGAPGTYSRLHGVDMNEFKKVLSSIELLGKTDVTNECAVGVQLLQVAENRKETSSIVQRLKDFRIDFVEIRPAIDIDNTINEVTEINEADIDHLEGFGGEHFKVMVRHERFKMCSGYGKDYNKCISPHFIAAFGADGNVYTCCEFLGSKNYILGNFVNESLEDIFQFNRMEKKLGELNLSKCPKYCKTELINQAFNRLCNIRHFNIL
ncbi:MAG: radical SAM protein [Planctomycetota bacterium]